MRALSYQDLGVLSVSGASRPRTVDGWGRPRADAPGLPVRGLVPLIKEFASAVLPDVDANSLVNGGRVRGDAIRSR
ncbi:hypothetical protein COO58_23220 [Micromonospora sp. WMMA1996]|nr:hypothetical protein COO58_23220 [Micromonospora sp. WMMA1996]